MVKSKGKDTARSLSLVNYFRKKGVFSRNKIELINRLPTGPIHGDGVDTFVGF